jgi:hypothetical protein
MIRRAVGAGGRWKLRVLPLLVMLAMPTLCASAQASSIAFLRGGNIWIANPDGSDAHALTTDGGYTFVSAAKAPGSMLLAFHQGNSMGVINADGSGEQTFAPPKGFAAVPDVVIDPSGHQLAYIAPTGYGYYGAVIDVNNSGPSGEFGGDYQAEDVDAGWADTSGTVGMWSGYLSKASANEPPPDCTPSGGTEQFGIAFQPVYYPPAAASTATGFFCILGQDVLQPKGSPDGTQVLATAGPRDGATRIIEVSESTMRSFTEPDPSVPFTYETPTSIIAGDPDWSPDGAEFAFDSSTAPATAPNEIWAGSLSGSPTMILSNASNPAWSPYSLPSPGPNPGPNPGPTPGPTVVGSPQIHSQVMRRAHKAKFTFSEEGAARFQCSLVKLKPHGKKPKPHYSACRSPKTYKGLRSGRYEFFARGLNSAGTAGKATAKSFKI